MMPVTKELTKSDVSSHHCRLKLGMGVVESQILCHLSPEEARDAREGKERPVDVWDLNTRSRHCMTLKRWKGDTSYVLTNNWSTEFVKRRKLNAGDQILLHWDTHNHCLVFSVLFRQFPI